MLLFDSLQKMSAWLLLELEEAFGAQSLSGCFFCMSAKHFEHRFIVLLDPQKPQGQRGGITLTLLGGLLPSLPVSPMSALPCEALRVAGESGDGVRASYLRLDFSCL